MKIHASETIDAVTMTPSEGTAFLVAAYKADVFKRTPLFRGSPGCGKTSAVRAAAKKLAEEYPGFKYIEINPTMPADEVGGIPDIIRVEGQASRTDYALPSWFPKAEDDPDWKGIICLDDALQGDRMMQQTLANLILARNLRGHALPEGAMIVATGNRVEDKAGVTRTLTHFADRMCWINISTDADSWISDFAIPQGLNPKTIGYILSDKSKLDMFDPDKEKCATARTWEAVSDWTDFLDDLTAGDFANKNKLAQSILGGELGYGEATRYWAFCSLWGKLPDVDELLADPTNAPATFAPDVQYALVVAIANKLNDKNFKSALTYVDRIGQDFTTLMVKVGTISKPELRKSKTWYEWAVANQDLTHGA